MASAKEIPAGNIAEYLSTQSMLETQRKLYKSVNLSKLPDNGIKIKNRIEELEESLKKLMLGKEKASSTVNHGTENAFSINEHRREKASTASERIGEKISPFNEHRRDKASSTAESEGKIASSTIGHARETESSTNGYKEKASSAAERIREKASSSGGHGKEKASPVDKPSTLTCNAASKSSNCSDSLSLSAKTKCVPKFGNTNDTLLTFSDLSKMTSNSMLNNFVTGSPSFKTWRGQEDKKSIKLTEAKPLLETQTKKSLFTSSISSSSSRTVSTDSVVKLHNSIATYPEDAEEECEPVDLKTTLMTHQKKALAWLIWREAQQPSGGILADDMGLGKTLTLIALIVKQKELKNYSTACSDCDVNLCSGTLIIAPASIIHQWEDEIIKHCERDCLTVLLYHGTKRPKNKKDVIDNDVVITTYSTLLAEFKKEKSPIFQLKWERIILDEAHSIKNYASQTSQAVFTLKSFRKWAVTGTPIHNNFKDMFSLFKFLEFSPFDNLKMFKDLVENDADESKKRRNLLMKSILLRRTKTQKDDGGQPLIAMKKKAILIKYIELSAEEKEVYEKLNDKVKEKVNKHFSKLKDTGKGTRNLLVLLLRLQQCCNHISLLSKDTDDLLEESISDSVSDLTKSINSLNFSPPELESSDSCESLDSSVNISLSEFQECDLKNISFKSTKIMELFKELEKISVDSKEKDKCVIISQWVSMLEVVAYHLKEENKSYLKIIGSTKVEDRQKAINNFNNDPTGPRVMLLSLKAGGVGLNLTGANHLFLLDLHWNPALEMQACDRIHRVGQKKDVFVHKFVCKNTIEEKILSLQNEKSNLAANVLHGAKKASKGLTLEDFKVLFNLRFK